MTDLMEKTLDATTIYDGRIVRLEVLNVELPDGRKVRREVARHCQAVAILARRPDGKFIFVRQYRKPIDAAILEIIAGCMEAGEEPEVSARREVAEETGYDVVKMKKLTSIVSSPGFCDEILHLFYAELTPRAHAQDQDPDENVYAVEFTEEEITQLILGGEISDAKTIAAWGYYQLARQNRLLE
ncbi:MAG: NUDIX hydrolase [Lentisphaeria bacterium]|nr:NUDIX hydrolase [Lentisphaeria bacterium]